MHRKLISTKQSILNQNQFIKTLSTLGLTTQQIKAISQSLNDPNKRITLVVNTDFEKSNQLTIDFLNSGHKKIVALKGLNGVTNEFYFDGHPKAVKVNRESLAKVGIELPTSGYIDTQNISEEERADLKAKILLLKEELPEDILKQVELLEEKKFATLQGDKKQTIDENTVIYANAHIFDIKIKVNGETITIPTFKQSPVIADDIEIIGVGDDTINNWGNVLNSTDLLIAYGDMTPYQNAFENQEIEIITIPE